MCQTGRVGKRQDSRSSSRKKSSNLGRRQLVDQGAAGLSLRAIARDLGMVSSAVYRYVSSRDELLTLAARRRLCRSGDTVDRARDSQPNCGAMTSSPSRMLCARWAVAHPARWALLYGSPVPG